MFKTRFISILALLAAVATGAWAFSGSGTSESPYLIASTTDWNNLVTAVNGGNTYSGKYFKMTANVGTVSTWMTGTFSGTFDGDGNTLTVGYSTSARYCAPFGTLGGTVKKLRVAGTLSSSAKNFGGIAAQVASGKTVTIQNCRVSATLTSTLSGDNSSGGFVGVVGSGGTLNITGCAFTGSLQGSGATACGGFLGYKEGTCSMTDCLFAPASVTMSPTYAGTFSRPSAPTMTRCYFTRTLGTAQGLQARTIAAGDGVSSLSVTKGSGTTYNVAGITVYSNGVDYNSTFYGGSGQSVSLALTAETRSGYQFTQYAASQGTLSDETTNTPTLTMPDANSTANDVVTISAEYDPTYTVTLKEGTDDADNWTITPAEATTTGVAAGTEVKATYSGTKKVKSVKAKKMSPIISLSDRTKLDDELVIADGYIVTGNAVSYSCKVAVADGATVTLRDVENTGYIDGGLTTCPGIKCLGDATIILEGDNTVTGGDTYAGIYVPEGKTLTIRGTGSLTVTGGISGAGIGGNNGGNCGSIVISGGTITATGGSGGAGIGLGYSSGCEFGDITISGGTVTATGSGNAPGIGGPYAYFKNITITDDVTKVTVNKGSNSTYSIGTSESDDMEYCGAITIGGTVYLNEGYFENGGDSYLQTSPLVYQP